MAPFDLTITHIGTATAIITVNGVNILTDPVFPSAGSQYQGKATVLKDPELPALSLAQLPHIDAVLLSHEDHPDNLDENGRTLLHGRKVLTTMDGKKNLGPRPDVYGMQPWEKRSFNFGGKQFEITATPCRHLPGGECIGFLVQAESFGKGSNGLPNAIYISGDTVYFEELKEIANRVNVVVAVMNFGAAKVPMPDEMLQITMDGKQGARLAKDLSAEVVVPMHFASWSHFTEKEEALVRAFEEESVSEKIRWLIRGQPVKVV